MNLEYPVEEGVAWPSYVDFLSTFIFILIIFLGSLLYLMANGVRQQRFMADARSSMADFKNINIHPVVGKMNETFSLSEQLQFEIGCPGKADCPADLSPGARSKLTQVANIIGKKHASCTRIVIRGQADAQKFSNDPDFGNYELSNRRASLVLRYLYNCVDCDKDFRALRSKLTLAGVGDTLAAKNLLDNPNDRTVSVIIDYSGESVR